MKVNRSEKVHGTIVYIVTYIESKLGPRPLHGLGMEVEVCGRCLGVEGCFMMPKCTWSVLGSVE